MCFDTQVNQLIRLTSLYMCSLFTLLKMILDDVLVHWNAVSSFVCLQDSMLFDDLHSHDFLFGLDDLYLFFVWLDKINCPDMFNGVW